MTDVQREVIIRMLRKQYNERLAAVREELLALCLLKIQTRMLLNDSSTHR